MSKTLNVNSGNYTLRVPSGNTITLDTGAGVGSVAVTGNLNIAGETTIINSQDLNLKDNVIILNDGETGAGISLNVSGLQIDRGTENDGTVSSTVSVWFIFPFTIAIFFP